jgi:hypothetical protein
MSPTHQIFRSPLQRGQIAERFWLASATLALFVLQQ